MEIHIILAALFPIYIGSHASLQRPPSASPILKSKSSSSYQLQDDEEDEGESRSPMEGLTPSDAIMFPVLASVALGTLYFIIKWLDDPAILNKVLGWYFSALGIFGVGRLAKDTLDVVVGFIFPRVWAKGKDIFHIDQDVRRQVSKDGTHVNGITNPLPGRLSNVNFSTAVTNALWGVRGLLRTTYTLNLHIKAILPHQKSPIKLTSVLGLGIGVATITAYNVLDAPWYLTNLMGFGFCYGSLQLMSPTTFFTGSLVLLGLFFYDITMVFYTPLMVTVATSLDVPIKLVFPGSEGGRSSMLGLGDIVLPGILIALALRFDLYLHYLYLQTSSSESRPTSISKSNTKTITESHSTTPQKTSYKPATGLWGERFWTSSFTSSSKLIETGIEGMRFSKPYFKAALVGYIIGMITTLVVLNVFRHAQPALLYLVPGVVGALWGTAVVRGEFGVMWGYTEDGSLEEGGKKKDKGDDKKEDKKDKGEDKKEEKEKTLGQGVKEPEHPAPSNKTLTQDQEITEPETQETIPSAHDSDTSSILSDGSISWPSPTLPPISFPANNTGSEADDESIPTPSSSSLITRSQPAKNRNEENRKDEGKSEKNKNKNEAVEDHLFLFSISAPKSGLRGTVEK
ncbi:hypothetical protein EYC80_006704 [Monilinia laxa]|uniref:Peptidase A22B, signal peptide peptidase n=1 Tax=Monilinia laxa TaxID=61186 RepID=A0A5N6JZD1_MONLA|nr:hypothetical protein EYC80_006704 [Monilinia laxa]